MIRAIDISTWQGNIDWQQVKNSGIQAVWIKVAGADGGLYRDLKGQQNLNGASLVEMIYGTYFFASPSRSAGSATEQAQFAVSNGLGKGLLPPVLDLETNPEGMSYSEIDLWASEFCVAVHNLISRECIIYGGAWTGVGHTSEAPPCYFWVANYGQNTPSETPPNFDPPVPPQYESKGWSIWQFNSVTSVPGIQGAVDQNVIKPEFWEVLTNNQTGQVDDMPLNKGDQEFITETVIDNLVNAMRDLKGEILKDVINMAKINHKNLSDSLVAQGHDPLPEFTVNI